MVQTINGWLRKVPASWPLYIGVSFWAGWVFYRGATGALGPNPVEALEHEYGQLAIKLLILGLAVTPLRKWTGITLLRFRRAIGVSAFFLVLAHFTVWAVLDVQRLAGVWADIVKRPYITIGMAALLLLIPLGVTSNNWSIRKLGRRWRVLHRLVYPAAILAALHYVWLVKGFELEPYIYMAVILVLLAARVDWSRRLAPIFGTSRA
ncbi:protein-methionine-sulfoxide reductase heme-binding subunit MsrQ [Pelagovum pacificum]|uniref:Protein-methionine-sulfoxide reductase heme-binding subunit MsrQ n=1 Tax=Pelagovum pacificum TaxID=2588711 RepID=A0A5C5GHM0_9RHOB|nr:protein-methionine-sulfoxide reductase heme-binding subunit MsrQ [Pelagovum pacificum]QQA42587.1 protein-methionine-sulfoxide reductase heme-binding subunit MsrQ [Pelagovum pacificum]TNY34262.1 protein-methionine-sulfoxide reductase heme-binding subunit MsrQ [Pelagovum pacificum]